MSDFSRLHTAVKKGEAHSASERYNAKVRNALLDILDAITHKDADEIRRAHKSACEVLAEAYPRLPLKA